jgi:hypothetical protein
MLLGFIAVKSTDTRLRWASYRWVVWIDRVEEAKTRRLLVCWPESIFVCFPAILKCISMNTLADY